MSVMKHGVDAGKTHIFLRNMDSSPDASVLVVETVLLRDAVLVVFMVYNRHD